MAQWKYVDLSGQDKITIVGGMTDHKLSAWCVKPIKDDNQIVAKVNGNPTSPREYSVIGYIYYDDEIDVQLSTKVSWLVESVDSLQQALDTLNDMRDYQAAFARLVPKYAFPTDGFPGFGPGKTTGYDIYYPSVESVKS